MTNQLSQTSLKLWFGWMVANTIGGAIDSYLGETFFNLQSNSLMGLFLLALGIGIPISLCQTIFLTGKVPKVHRWVIMSSISSIVCITLSPYIILFSSIFLNFRPVNGPIGEGLCFGKFGLINGLVLGLAQWLFVLRKFPKSCQWIPFSSLGSAIGLSVGNAVALSLTGSIISAVDSPPMRGLVTMGAIARLLYGMITGVALVQFLQKETRHNSSN